MAADAIQCPRCANGRLTFARQPSGATVALCVHCGAAWDPTDGEVNKAPSIIAGTVMEHHAAFLDAALAVADKVTIVITRDGGEVS